MKLFYLQEKKTSGNAEFLTVLRTTHLGRDDCRALKQCLNFVIPIALSNDTCRTLSNKFSRFVIGLQSSFEYDVWWKIYFPVHKYILPWYSLIRDEKESSASSKSAYSPPGNLTGISQLRKTLIQGLMTCSLQIIYQSTEGLSIHSNGTNSTAIFTNGDHFPMIRWLYDWWECFRDESCLFVYIGYVWPSSH